MSLLRGKQAEKYAQAYLEKNKLVFIDKNFHCKYGEIDLIMKMNDEIIFIEVRARKSERFGSAAESINISKQKKIIKTSQYFLINNPSYQNLSIRFDAVLINSFNSTQIKEVQIDWVKDAFWANDSSLT